MIRSRLKHATVFVPVATTGEPQRQVAQRRELRTALASLCQVRFVFSLFCLSPDYL